MHKSLQMCEAPHPALRACTVRAVIGRVNTGRDTRPIRRPEPDGCAGPSPKMEAIKKLKGSGQAGGYPPERAMPSVSHAAGLMRSRVSAGNSHPLSPPDTGGGSFWPPSPARGGAHYENA